MNVINVLILGALAVMAALAGARRPLNKKKKALIAIAVATAIWALFYHFWQHTDAKRVRLTEDAQNSFLLSEPPADHLMAKSYEQIQSIESRAEASLSFLDGRQASEFLSNMAHIYWRKGHTDDARRMYEKVEALLDNRSDLSSADSQLVAGKVRISKGILAHEVGRLQAAEDALNEGIDILSPLIADDSIERKLRREAKGQVLKAERFLIQIQRRSADTVKLAQLIARVDSVVSRTVGGPDCVLLDKSTVGALEGIGTEIGRLLLTKGALLSELGEYAEAETTFRCTEELMEWLLDRGLEQRRFRYYCLSRLSGVLMRQSEFPEAEALGKKAVEHLREVDPGGFFYGDAVVGLAVLFIEKARKQPDTYDTEAIREVDTFFYQSLGERRDLIQEWETVRAAVVSN